MRWSAPARHSPPTRRRQDHLDRMRAEIARQSQPTLTDEDFCASDVAFHRAFVDGACNPVLSYQLAGAVEAMQPLMNMITFAPRSQTRIVDMHTKKKPDICRCDGRTGRFGGAVERGLDSARA